MPDITMADAAYASNLYGTSFPAVAGYYGGPNAYHVWSPGDWANFPGRKLPIWVAGYDGYSEGKAAVNALRNLGAKGVCTAVDMEGRIDRTYLESFGQELQHEGFKVWVYGSADSVFDNPELNGYWVADYAGIGAFMYNHNGVRATQYTSESLYDLSLVKEWVVASMWQ